MNESLEQLKDLAPLVTPFVPSIIDVFVKPKLQKLSKFLKSTNLESKDSIEARFTDYLNQSYQKHSYIPILIFQNQQRKLEDIYIPLTLRTEKREKHFLIDSYPEDFLPVYKKALIRDSAGMGKSTLMKRLFLSCLESRCGIPIFIELRKLNVGDSILDFINKELSPIDGELDRDFTLRLIKEGNFIFFLDGYDEISQSDREKVTQNLHDFISKTSNNLFIMTSRPETSLAAFPDFMEFDIQPLQLDEAFSLLRRYDSGGALSEEIIGKLEGKTLESVKDFLKNPLLVSLLYKSYEYKPTVPLKKHNFYRQVFDALFESHDLTKEGHYIRDKHSQLDTDSFHAVLRSLGFLTLKHGIEYDKDEILDFIRRAKEQCSTISFAESKFLEDLLKTVPVFSIESNKYRWSHKSLQDYFAAQFIWLDSNDNKIEILKKMVKSEENQKYYNVIDLYYDMDYRTFRQTIIYEFVTDAIEDSEIVPRLELASEKLTANQICDIKSTLFGQSLFFFPKLEWRRIEEQSKSRGVGDLINDTLTKKGFTLDGFSARFLLPTSSNGIICVYANYRQSLLYLLAEKGENIFESAEEVVHKRANRKTRKGKTKNIGFGGFSSSLIVMETDTVLELVFNSNRSLYFSSLKSELSIEKCRKLKVEIESEITKKSSSPLVDSL